MAPSEPVLAIDFGTSNSLAGAWVNGRRVEAFALDARAADPTLLRTLLYFLDSSRCYYGHDAITEYKEQGSEGRLFRSFKSHLPNKDYLGTYVGDRVLTLETMIGIFLLEMKKRCEALIGYSVDSAVVGKPARYSMDPVKDSFALHRMTKAIEFAGFKKFAFVPEPLAAAFEFRRNLDREQLILVGDFGGGTSDFTVMKVGPFPFQNEHVLGIEGCPLAGDSLDSLFMSHRLNRHFGSDAKYRMPFGSNILRMPPSVSQRINQPAHIVHLKDRETYAFIQEVRKCVVGPEDKRRVDQLCALVEDDQIFSFFERIENLKRQLSENEGSTFEFDYPGISVRESFTRDQLKEWSHSNRESIFLALDECLKAANLTADQIDLVCLTGGTAQVPLIRAELKTRFGEDKLQTQTHFHSVLSGLIEAAELWSQGRL